CRRSSPARYYQPAAARGMGTGRSVEAIARSGARSRIRSVLGGHAPAARRSARAPPDARDVDMMLDPPARGIHRLDFRAAPALRVEQPMGGARAVVVKVLAVVAAHAFGDDDLAVPDRAPLARVLAHLALAALRPAFDAKGRE